MEDFIKNEKQIVPTVNELYSISVAIKDIFKTKNINNISVQIELDEDTLNKVNEDLFYRNNPNAKKEDFSIADELKVNINDVNFNYIKKIKERK